MPGRFYTVRRNGQSEFASHYRAASAVVSRRLVCCPSPAARQCPCCKRLPPRAGWCAGFDWPFFPHAQDSPLAAIIHLDDASVDKGCVRVVPGSHRGGRLAHIGEPNWHLPVDQYPIDRSTPVPAAPGDVLFFRCLTVHGSGVNETDEARTTWLVQFRDPGDPPTLDRHRSPGQGRMLRGVNQGEFEPPPTTL